MGGRRPGQYQRDLVSTDHKFLEPDEGIKTMEKHELAQSESEQQEWQGMVPRTRGNPAAQELKQRKAEAREARGPKKPGEPAKRRNPTAGKTGRAGKNVRTKRAAGAAAKSAKGRGRPAGARAAARRGGPKRAKTSK